MCRTMNEDSYVMILDNETKKNSILHEKSTWESIKDIQVLLTLML